eukprot:TRINITY_DN6151_c0_g1_i2.p1 TRINITY_DN6151_c0_g1~~TRINITY_DN6151_c0_g1_i2.p1  ORF type:complete len:338 (+),score=59.81 TRINITY_DN6151_c0_g1_i2:167-1180(+)
MVETKADAGSGETTSIAPRMGEPTRCPTPNIRRDVRLDFTIGQEIGKGSFSVVNECWDKISGRQYAVKTISKERLKECVQIENEILILKKSCHHNVIGLRDVYETEENLYLVMELISGGDLHTEVSDIGPFSEKKAHEIFKQLFDAIRYLHSVHIVHRDLKLENILVSRTNGEPCLKLSDFGLSKILTPSNIEFMRTRCGTPTYVAPEILLGEPYTPSVDIWSMGVVLYVMVCQQYPFHATNLHEMYEMIITGRIQDFPVEISEELKDLISGMLTVDVTERLSISAIAAHPWLRKFSTPELAVTSEMSQGLSEDANSVMDIGGSQDWNSSSAIVVCS